MLVPNRHASSTAYRYGFNGKEKDDELKGEGNSYDFGARMLDPRVGRWFKTDPVFERYPYDSPYMFAGNSPISVIDPDGARKKKVTNIYNENGEFVRQEIKVVDYSFIKKSEYNRDKLILFGKEIYNDQVIEYDYYDSVDLVMAVQDANGKIIYSEIIQTDILAEKRIDNVDPATSGLVSNAVSLSDRAEDMAVEAKSNGGGYDFYSKKGEGSGIVAINRENTDMVNGDDMIALLKAGKGIGDKMRDPSDPFPTSVSRKSDAVKFMEKFKKGFKAAEKIMKSIEKVKNQLSKCEICNRYFGPNKKEVDSTNLSNSQKTDTKKITPDEH